MHTSTGKLIQCDILQYISLGWNDTLRFASRAPSLFTDVTSQHIHGVYSISTADLSWLIDRLID